jgi:hypothetical protein
MSLNYNMPLGSKRSRAAKQKRDYGHAAFKKHATTPPDPLVVPKTWIIVPQTKHFRKGLNMCQAAFANKKYRSHQRVGSQVIL